MYSYDDMPKPTWEELHDLFPIALKRLRDKQHQLNCYPQWEIFIQWRDAHNNGSYLDRVFGINLNPNGPVYGLIRFTFPTAACLYAMLQRKIHFNNLEVGCHIKIHREPNEYCPDIHTLMSFFHI